MRLSSLGLYSRRVPVISERLSNFILQVQLNDIQYLEVVYRCEHFGRESTGMKFRDKDSAKMVYRHMPANFEHWVGSSGGLVKTVPRVPADSVITSQEG